MTAPRQPRKKPVAWSKWINVTVSLEPCDAPLLKVIKARYNVTSTSHALRMLLRDSCGYHTSESESKQEDQTE